MQRFSYIMSLFLGFTSGGLIAQDTTRVQPVKYTFESAMLIDNQTVIVPVKKTVEFDIQHRFGTINNGADDVFGIFAPSNIRLGLAYVPVKRLMVGIGLTKERMQVDLNAKYVILQQTPGGMPVTVAYFGDIGFDTRDGKKFRHDVHRFSYFNQLLIARKISKRFSIQVAPSFSWFNNVDAYVASDGEIKKKMENGHLAIAFMGVFKINKTIAIIANYDQPVTKHPTNNPSPNISMGVEFSTGSHAFQVFFGNYAYILQQNNNYYNQNDYLKSQYVIGFNITRLWN